MAGGNTFWSRQNQVALGGQHSLTKPAFCPDNTHIMKTHRASVLVKKRSARTGLDRTSKTGKSHALIVSARTSDQHSVQVKLDLVKKTVILTAPRHVEIIEESEARFVSGLIKATPITPERLRAAEARASRARTARAGALTGKRAPKIA